MSEHKTGPIPDPMCVELRIPVDVKMTGYATIRVPVDASEADIDNALESVDIDQMKLEPDDNRDGWFKDHQSKHLKKLNKIGEVLKSLNKMDIAVVTNQCCSSCSYAEGIDVLSKDGRFTGFAFIHAQDVESLMKCGKIHVGFSSRSTNREDDIEFGKKIRQAFVDAGFEVKWDETSETRLEITGFNPFSREAYWKSFRPQNVPTN